MYGAILVWLRRVVALTGLPAWALALGFVALLLWLRRRRRLSKQRALRRALSTSPRLSTPLHMVVVCVGTRGDCQPFVALGRHLVDRGHQVTICTCDQFRELVESNGLAFASCGVDRVQQGEEWLTATSMAEFVTASVHSMEKNTMPMARAVWNVCTGSTKNVPKADAILVNLFAQHMGLDLAEALHIPCWLLKLCPDVPTRAVAPFGEAPSRFGWMNLARHYLRLVVMVRAAGKTNLTARQNQYRREVFGLPAVGLKRLSVMNHTPTLHGYSPALLPKPHDWGDWLMVPGFWFLDGPKSYAPPPALTAFLDTATPPVCVTFGSMAVVDSTDVLRNAVDAVLASGNRCLVVSGWASPPADLPSDRVHVIPSAPHEWLFPRCRAVVCHGGAGTFARVVHAGIPCVVVPILRFFDQAGWGATAENKGIGVCVRGTPSSDAIQAALEHVLTDTVVAQAKEVGAEVQGESGLVRAVEQLEWCLCARLRGAPGISDAVVEMCRKNCLACRGWQLREAASSG